LSKKRSALAVCTISIVCLAGVGIWVVFLMYPSTLPLGETPAISLPLNDFSHNSYIGGFGQIQSHFFHNGFDFGVNGTTVFVAVFDAYVMDVKSNWYNERGGHWQTNVGLWINPQWRIEMAFESWALNETYGALQASAISVIRGQHIAANQTIGSLLVHGQYAHVHFGVRSWGNDVCPYYYFTEPAKASFAFQFARVNITSGWDM